MIISKINGTRFDYDLYTEFENELNLEEILKSQTSKKCSLYFEHESIIYPSGVSSVEIDLKIDLNVNHRIRYKSGYISMLRSIWPIFFSILIVCALIGRYLLIYTFSYRLIYAQRFIKIGNLRFAQSIGFNEDIPSKR